MPSELYENFLKKFLFDKKGYIGFSNPTIANLIYYAVDKINDLHVAPEKQYYFTPSLHSAPSRTSSKEDILGTAALWADCDNCNFKELETVIPPSLIVNSGHGLHLYFLLHEPLLDRGEIERCNQILLHLIKNVDKGCWNANRLLRLPYSSNLKDVANPVPVQILQQDNGLRYSISDINGFAKLSKEIRELIISGPTEDYESRSEFDWLIVTNMIASGISREIIRACFEINRCGEKVREEFLARSSNDHYFDETYRKASESGAVESIKTGNGNSKKASIIETDDGYYAGSQKLSTFTLKPQLILESVNSNDADTIICTVLTKGGVPVPDIPFPKHAFNGNATFDKSLPNVNWQWIGSDQQARKLLPLLVDVTKNDIPRTKATSTMGLHQINQRWYFVGDESTISSDSTFNRFTAPIVWLPNKKEHPHLILEPEVEENELKVIRENLLKLNLPSVMWSLIGWFTAANFKPWIEQHNYRFPLLDVFGTKGSGKTTLIVRVLMPLFGQASAVDWDAGTTNFVIRALCGSTNATPIAFSEFRYSQVKSFIRVMLLSYDTGFDARGTSAQETITYPLSAPILITGEDVVDDPAVQERILLVKLDPHSVEENTEAYQTFMNFRNLIPKKFGAWMIQQSLKLIENGEAHEILVKSAKNIFEVFPQKIPDRIRNNHIITYFGASVFSKLLGIDLPSPLKILSSSINHLIGKSGRGKTKADDFITDIINSIQKGGVRNFPFDYNAQSNALYFQLKPAHDFWVIKSLREQRSILEVTAIRNQLEEAEYYIDTKIVNRAMMIGVSIDRIAAMELDIPSRLSIDTISISMPRTE